ncbi:MAG: ATP-binding protein [Anaerolineales bacterium]|jgi:signal transduction histidine kinase/HAMP domain-containing protein|nr:ATP-binding protein [Anaerolineales bacterium]
MESIFSLFQGDFLSPLWPSLLGWLWWFLLAALIGWTLFSWRNVPLVWDSRTWGLILLLSVFVILSNNFIGLRLPAGSALPPPGIPQSPRGPALMVFSALPWLLAGGLLGPAAAALVGFVAGLIRFAIDTQSVYTPLEMALLAAIFSVAVRQRFRTWPYHLLREPLFAALLLSLPFALLFAAGAFMIVAGPIETRLDYALTQLQYATLAFAGEMLVGGLFSQTLALVFPDAWGRRLPLQPSPGERSLEARFLFGTGTLITSLLLALLVGDWLVAGSASRQMLEFRLQGNAQLASQSVPFFLETGQNLASQHALSPELLGDDPRQMTTILEKQLRAIPFFDQLMVLDRQGNLLAYYPLAAPEQQILAPQESAGLALAFSGVRSQTYTIPPANGGNAARISFVIGLVADGTDLPSRVLIGRTNLETNPFTQPLIDSLASVRDLEGDGILLDEDRTIIYHNNPSLVMTPYSGQVPLEAAFFDDTSPSGTRSLVYFQPTLGRPWSVVLTVPAQQAQKRALALAAPLSIMIVALAVVALFSLKFGLRSVTSSMQTLASEAVRIAQGQLDHPLPVEGVDEVGQLRRAFEQMRSSLQSRLEELNRLLLVSQGVASSLDMGDSVEPVLEAILATGASAVRVVLTQDSLQDTERDIPSLFALGPSKEKYAYLDEQILELTQQQDRIVLTNVARARTFGLPAGQPAPASLVAFPLRHENRHYGALWAAYDQPRLFSETDVRFLATLSGQAALAASNNHLFLSAEVGRQRLAAILASTPDPVLVTDHLNRLLLANPAAWKTLGDGVSSGEGQPIERLISYKPLLEILQVSSPDKLSAEVTVAKGQVYLATASPVMADGRLVGRVCILRDVTYFKELDTMKTEFVNTVSHDLRSPLTLMRGYATMLEMVGELNEQQQGYVKKIISGVENMARLVNNLLDLGRIEVGVGLQLETAPIFEIVERVTSTLQTQASQKNIILTVDMPADMSVLIEADTALLQQAMYNLVENAVKYTPQDGRVLVHARVATETFYFDVQDSGIGVSPIDQPRLFEKFYRGGQREAREQKGSGLGLAIVRSIIERHGGKIWLESQLGKGSTFFFEVPLRQSDGLPKSG